MRQAIAVLLSPDQIREEVVGESAAPPRNHLVYVACEFRRSAQDVARVLYAVADEDLDNVVGPPGQEQRVGRGRSEQLADDRNRVGPSYVRDDFRPARACHEVDQLANDGGHCGPERRCTVGRECPTSEAPKPAVLLAVAGQQA